MYTRVTLCGKRGIIRKWCARSCSINPYHVDSLEPKAFEDIPGPKSLPFIGTLYKYLPFIGEYSFAKLHYNGLLKRKQYGPLVREEIIPGQHMVWVFRPEDIAEIFKAETGLHPKRRSHLALLKYRKDRSNVYNTGGLLPTNGTEWWRLRREFQKVLSKPRNVVDYLEDTDAVVQEFVQLCSREKADDFLPLLSHLFLELTCLVAFDVKMRSLSEEEKHSHSRSSRLIKAAFTTNSAILKLDNSLMLWRFFETPLYRKLRKAQNYMEEVALQMVSERHRDALICRKQSLLGEYLKNEALDIKDIVGMACDMLLAGMDTTTYSTSFALYHLARNTDVQEKLRSEAAALLTDPVSPITPEILRNATYVKAVIKETFRLNPISVGIGRILQTDVVLSGYRVPKGTLVVTQNQVICRLAEYFDEPTSFKPERWLRDSNDKVNKREKAINPYIVLPFGHGPRSCIARRFAEQSLQVVLLRICRNLRFTWCGEPLDSVSSLINKPDAPIKLRFENIHS
ncbi:PREDICTED: cytochrome P450 302a1, mitochondrial isoform X2 [Vollenhovia emeryi]|uniref:cytochrome P450 302a1, mitochondrial isoform X2 n=1 Tax=Vollenhovia emeryi TaxID=411798 RepID=UPI0005F43616|nr:PREDICTED: cytochrome P450 302a1, mitochondrial isoform X2 [Vollenhovia emeryi]